MSKDLEIIKEKIAKKKDFLRETYGVEEIGVFGSFVQGNNNESSDIDIAVELNHKIPVGFFEFARMQRYLENLLGRNVDLVTKRSIKPFIKDRILAQMIII